LATIAFRPGVEIETRFQQATSTAVPTLSGFIVGPAARVTRYAVSSEREDGLLGTYDIDGSSDPNWNYYNYPKFVAGDAPDKSFTRLFLKNAMLNYWHKDAGSFKAGSLNNIYLTGTNFTDNGAYTKHASLGDRGVKIGDRIRISGVDSNSDPFTLSSYVTGFTWDLTSAVVNASVAASGNTGSLSSASNTVDGATNSPDITAAEDASGYDGRPSGVMSETYLVTVIRSSIGGDATTGLLSVTSASGTDDQTTVVPAAFSSPTLIGTRGLELTFIAASSGDNLVAGDNWTVTVTQANTAPTFTATGTYSATDGKDRTYTIEVVQGGTLASGPVVRITEARGRDVSSSKTMVIDSGSTTTDFAIGSYGVGGKFVASTGLVKGDTWTIEATASQPRNYNGLKLAHNMPSNITLGSTAIDLEVDLYIHGDYEIPEKSPVVGRFNFVAEDEQIKLTTGLLISEPTWTVDGDVVPLLVESPAGFTDINQVYSTTRLWAAAQTSIASMTELSELETLVTGPLDEDNPLKYALSKALAGSSGRTVYYFNTGDPSVQGNWSTAFSSSERTRDAYGLVPLTNDLAILNLAQTFVNTMSSSSVNMDKVLWVTAPPLSTIVVNDATNSLDGEPILATVTDDLGTTITDHTYLNVTSGNCDFVASGVRAGDSVRINFSSDGWGVETYETYVVKEVVNAVALILVAGPSSALSTPRRVEIVRTPTVADRVAERIDYAANFQNYNVRYIPVSTTVSDSVAVPAYHLASYLAGLRSALAPHQAMTRYPISTFTALPELDSLTEATLNDMAEVGCFLVTQEPQLSLLTVRHGITTGDYSNVNTREESIISNVHSIKFALFDVLNPYIGQSNLTSSTMALITTSINGLAQSLLSANANSALGGQITSLEILKLRQSPVAKDTLLVEVEIGVPGPTNRIRLTLFVN
jgi:hypothetical protein